MNEKIDIVFDKMSILIEDSNASVSFTIDEEKLFYTDWFRINTETWGCLDYEGHIEINNG